MRGLWKLAAMSAVVGAGLVIAWQAQQGLTALPQTGPAPAGSAEADGFDPQASVDDLLKSTTTKLVDTATTQVEALIEEQVATAIEPVKAAVRPAAWDWSSATASVPPEKTAVDAATQLLATNPEAARYRRTAATEPSAQSTIAPQPLPADESATPLTIGTPAEGPTLVPTPEKTVSNIVQTAAQESGDPFFDAPPPALKTVPATKPTVFPAEPEMAPAPELGTPNFEPFPEETPRPRNTPMPTEVEDPFANPNTAPSPPAPNPASTPKPAPFEPTDPSNTLRDPLTDPRMTPDPAADKPTAVEPEVDPFAPSVNPKRNPEPTLNDPLVDPRLDPTLPVITPGTPKPQPEPYRTRSEPTAVTPAPMDSDPFSGANPGRAPTTPRRTEPQEPASTPDAFDPFPEAAPRTPANPSRATPPGMNNEPDPFDPFPADKPAAPQNPAPAVNEADPFDGAAPGRDPAPRNPLPRMEPDPMEPPPRRAPLRDPSLLERAPAEPSSNDRTNLFQGDGIVTDSVPRGVQEPRLTIEKLAPSKAVLGQPLIYTVVVKNTGGSAANQVTVEDRIPRGSRLIGTAPRAELSDKRLFWKRPVLAPGEEWRIAIKVVPEEEGPIGSVAKVNFVAEVAAEIVITAPQLKLRVSGPNEIKMGEQAELVFVLSNPGDGDAQNVVLRSIIPEGLSHPAGNDLEYKIEKLAARESREIRLEMTGVKPGRLMHQAVATADGNLTTEAQTAVEVIGEQLLLTRSGPARVYIGRSVVFTNRVANEGQRQVGRIRLTESVPEGLDFVEASDGGHYDASSRTITWTVGPLNPAAEQRVTATLSPKVVGHYDAIVTATGPTGSVATVKPQTTVEGFPALAVEPSGNQRLVSVGERVTAKVQVKNQGTAEAQRVRIAIDLPSELKLVSVKSPTNYQVVGQRLVFDPVDSLPPRTGATYELVLEALAAGDSRLEMQIAADHLKRPIKHDEAVQVIDGQ